MPRFATSRDFFRAHVWDALTHGEAHARGAGSLALTETQRYAQVVEAKRLRNFWFTSQLVNKVKEIKRFLNSNNNFIGPTSNTPRFSEPVIVTDMVSLWEPPLEKNIDDIILSVASIMQYGGEGNAYGQNFFNSDTPIISWLTVKHERNRRMVDSTGIHPVNELMDKDLPFVPHLLRPYEFLTITFFQDVDYRIDFGIPAAHCGFRGIRILNDDSAYAKLTALADQQVRGYIRGSSPETFFLEVKTPIANLGAINSGYVELRTPQQDRPLLILGAASNVEGCQVRILEESSYYQFTYQDKPDSRPFPQGQTYTDPPLQLVAPDTDFRNVDVFNMWPVPHVLEPGAQLRIRLNNGLLPAVTDGALQQAAATRSSQDARITFLCRTP